jgi:hypothetical protein
MFLSSASVTLLGFKLWKHQRFFVASTAPLVGKTLSQMLGFTSPINHITEGGFS